MANYSGKGSSLEIFVKFLQYVDYIFFYWLHCFLKQKMSKHVLIPAFGIFDNHKGQLQFLGDKLTLFEHSEATYM